MPGDGHVDDVARCQVQLDGTAGPFDDDQIEALPQAVEGRGDDGPKLTLALLQFAGGQGLPDPAQHDHLGTRMPLRLEKHRVHVGV